jgi:hypothetical protein
MDFRCDQFQACANLFAAPLWIAGLLCFLRDWRYRLLAWMYLIPLALFLAAKGRGYYLAAAYPMLIAMGAIAGGHSNPCSSSRSRPVEYSAVR